MRMIQAWVLMLAALPGSVAIAAEPDDPAKDIERRIDQAREQLDEAARKLAELHTQMWRLETTGPRAERPMLGILLEDSGTAAGLGLGGVTPEGGAERAGLRAGDVIVEVNGVRLDDGGGKKPLHALSEAMASVTAGDTVPVTYVRDGETHQAEVSTQARGRYMAKVVVEKQPWLDSLRSLGNLEDLEALKGLEEMHVLEGLDDEELEGLIVRVPAGLRLERVEGDLASYFGVDAGVLVLEPPRRASPLKAGDVLLSLDGEPVEGVDGALRQFAALTGTVPARVQRHGNAMDISLNAADLNAEQSLNVFRGDRRVRIHRDTDGDKVRLEITVQD